MRRFPNLRFPEFEGEWEEKNLGEVADVSKLAGYEFTKYIIYEEKGKIIALRGLNIKNNKLDLSDVKYIDNSDLSKLNRSKLFIDDLMFTYIGTIGEVALIEENDRFYLAPNVSRIRANKDKIAPRFLLQYFNQPNFRNVEISKYISSSSQPALTMENVRKFAITLPTLSEQKKIAIFLSLLDKRIATQSQIIENLQSLIKTMCKVYHNSVEKTEYKIASLGIPFKAMNLSKDDLSSEGEKCILYGELFTTYNCVIDEVVSFTKYNSSSKTLSGENDLLFPASTTVDSLSLISPSAISIKNVILGGDMFGIRLHKNFNNKYVSYVINYIYKKCLAKYAQGSTIVHLYYDNIKDIKIMLPNLETQCFFVDIM